MNWKCTGFYHSETGDGCQYCGKGINNIFTITADDGTTMRVGSECVKTLTMGVGAEGFDKAAKRASRAARQWNDFRKGKPAPAPLKGETREAYINRRVKEMAVAYRAASQAVAITARRANRYRGKGHPSIIAAGRLMRQWGIEYPGAYKPGWAEHEQLRSALTEMFTERWQQRIARRLGANAYDIFRPIWQVAKI